MNTTVKYIIAGTIGAGIGWFVGSVIAEVIAIKEAGGGYEDTEEFPQEGEDNPDQGQNVVLDKKKKMSTKTKNYTQYFKEQGRPDLAKLAAKYNSGEIGSEEASDIPAVEEEEIEGIQEENFENEEEEAEGIVVVSLAEFASNEDYESRTLSYYDDDILTDEKNNPIDRPENILGDEALVSFGMLSDDEDVVYVRNDFNHCMYEVVRAGRPYHITPERHIAMKKQKKVEEEDGEIDNAQE
jgi:hypothetical protein